MKNGSGESNLAVLASRRNKGLVLAWFVLVLSMATAVWAWWSNRNLAREKARIVFHRETERSKEAIRGRLQIYEAALYGTRSLFESNPLVTRQIFHDYVANLKLQQRFPGIQGIGFSLHVT